MVAREIIILILALVSILVGIILPAETFWQKIIIWIILAIPYICSILSTNREYKGTIRRDKSFPDGTLSVVFGHAPFSVILAITMSVQGKKESIIEGLELYNISQSYKRKIKGQLFEIKLLTFNCNGFTLEWIGSSGTTFEVKYCAKYNIWNDILKKLAYQKK